MYFSINIYNFYRERLCIYVGNGFVFMLGTVLYLCWERFCIYVGNGFVFMLGTVLYLCWERFCIYIWNGRVYINGTVATVPYMLFGYGIYDKISSKFFSFLNIVIETN